MGQGQTVAVASARSLCRAPLNRTVSKVYHLPSESQLLVQFTDKSAEVIPLSGQLPILNPMMQICSDATSKVYLTHENKVIECHSALSFESPFLLNAIYHCCTLRHFTAQYQKFKKPVDAFLALTLSQIHISKGKLIVVYKTMGQNRMVSLNRLQSHMHKYGIRWLDSQIVSIITSVYQIMLKMADITFFSLQEILIAEDSSIYLFGRHFLMKEGTVHEHILDQIKGFFGRLVQNEDYPAAWKCLNKLSGDQTGGAVASLPYIRNYMESYFRNTQHLKEMNNDELMEIYMAVGNQEPLIREMTKRAKSQIYDAQDEWGLDCYFKAVEAAQGRAVSASLKLTLYEKVVKFAKNQFKKGKYFLAIQSLQRLEKYYPKDVEIMVQLGEIHTILCNFTLAARSVALILAKQEDSLPVMERVIAICIEVDLDLAVRLMGKHESLFMDDYRYDYYAGKIMLIKALAEGSTKRGDREIKMGEIKMGETTKSTVTPTNKPISRFIPDASDTQVSPMRPTISQFSPRWAGSSMCDSLLNQSYSLLECALSCHIPEKWLLMKTLQSLGDIQLYRKNLTASEEYYSKAKLLYVTEEVACVDRYASVVASLANVEFMRGNYRGALEYYDEAIRKMSPENIHLKNYVMGNMGLVQLELNHHEDAICTLKYVLQRVTQQEQSTPDYLFFRQKLHQAQAQTNRNWDSKKVAHQVIESV